MSLISTNMPPAPQRYKHSQLDKTKKEIRLVQIQPDSDDKSTLQLVLKTAILAQKNDAESGYQVESVPQVKTSPYVESSSQVGTSSHVDSEEQDSRNSFKPMTPSKPIAAEGDDAGNEFIALSYMWGPETPSHDILIVDSKNTGWISIRQNLFDFLTTRRDSSVPSPWFWIDQLCINQEDGQEKGHQVNQMSQLYSTATKVEVWLGLGFEGSDEAFDYMNQNIGTHWRDWPESQTKAHFSAFRSIGNLSYWSRLWIVQEVLLGHDITVRLGTKDAPWPDAFWHLSFQFIGGPLWWLRRNYTLEGGLHHWGNIIELAMARECTVVKDHVFAMMGLVTEPLRFFPDYSMHIQDILLKMLRSQAAHLARQPPESYRQPYFDYYNDIERCAKLWFMILDRDDGEIDPRSVRNSLLEEAHPLLRRSAYSETSIQRYGAWRRSKFQLLFSPGVGPTLLVRLNMRWLYPGRHSTLWRYRNRKRQDRLNMH